MESGFLPGVELARRFYEEAVNPLLRGQFPRLTHSAALIGSGSEVLGFDTARSMDHDWGPRLQIFVRTDDLAAHGGAVDRLLAERLPAMVAGFPTNLEPAGNAARGTRHMRPTRGPVRHGVVVAGLTEWLTGHLGFDPLTGVTTLDWLATPTQTLTEVTSGAVFHDGLRQLQQARQALAWYPDDVWRHVLACQWRRISQEEAFVGRCGEVGDDLGSAIVTARLTRDLVRLCLLMNRVYPPYSKWLGSAFARLPRAAVLTPVLTAALVATDWHDREHHLTRAYETIADLHNELGLTDWVDPTVRPFHDRPFQVLDADRFATALAGTITDPRLRARPLTGALDQVVDNTDALGDRIRRRALANALDVADLPDLAGPEAGLPER
ncbi:MULTISPECIES: DUF4037 domain-containing protein [Pseudofrankia]|uniref:DUF4037 domain-containing protein n=1 Tax=Pseudofrankia TaxID=2994363 RepID=UPI000234CB45|nr:MULTISPECIES: DUF4037 domain-containing protein [Pseudofrankia]OHV37066.1 hypothetical protein BCD49_17855 [Pseudofrankia sp. EUN1h]